MIKRYPSIMDKKLPKSILDLFPQSWRNDQGVLSFEKMREREELAKNAVAEFVSQPHVKFETRKTLFLVDVYGIFLRITNWMVRHDIPITTSELPIRYAADLLMNAAEGVRTRETHRLSFEGIDYDDLVHQIYSERYDMTTNIEAVTRIEANWELFFAPAPMDEVEYRASTAPMGHNDRAQILSQLNKGIVSTDHGPKDYRIYDDFTSGLAGHLGAKIAEKGFYGVHVDARKGTVGLSEKEVDIRIAIRAMDFLAGGEGNSICIVSSDQDYMPLHQRCRDAGLDTYHSDVAKFEMHNNIGRRIRDLGDEHILVSLGDDIHNGIIQEHLEPRGPLKLSKEQYSAIWQLQTIY